MEGRSIPQPGSATVPRAMALLTEIVAELDGLLEIDEFEDYGPNGCGSTSPSPAAISALLPRRGCASSGRW